MSDQPPKSRYQSPLPEEELRRRMGSSAGRKLEARLAAAGWTADSRLGEQRDGGESHVSPGGDLPTPDLP